MVECSREMFRAGLGTNEGAILRYYQHGERTNEIDGARGHFEHEFPMYPMIPVSMPTEVNSLPLQEPILFEDFWHMPRQPCTEWTSGVAYPGEQFGFHTETYSIKPVIFPMLQDHTLYNERLAYTPLSDGTPNFYKVFEPYANVKLVKVEGAFYSGHIFYNEVLVNGPRSEACSLQVPLYNRINELPYNIKVMGRQRELWEYSYLNGVHEFKVKDTFFEQSGVLYFGSQYPHGMYYICSKVKPLLP